MVLVSILIGSEVAGVLGALSAVAVAGTLQILLIDWLEHRRMAADESPPAAVAAEAVEEPTAT